MQTDTVCQSQFVSMNGSTTPVLSRLSYLASEPFAVTIAFRTDRGHWIEWAFARDLLVEGMRNPTGIGDVRIRPDLSTHEDILALEIESPEGYALVEIERDDVEAFLDRTLAIVPLGEESENFDVDAFIEEITNV
ncbi:SsgA family sporulation/cell division regulator [Amycolatopsis anabasis]|uniref:SsgA family sporulation/cell division regulator n=1 Tax=Amycolatopsis anabasis TaxID=1840409 RepID=UPI00131CF74E|nr:SsgA family sporulation/cell division regulator [Amycolatopsis anabasis]